MSYRTITSRHSADEEVQVNFNFHQSGHSTLSLASTAPQSEEIVLFGCCWKGAEIPKRSIMSCYDFLLISCNCTNLHSCIPPFRLLFSGVSVTCIRFFYLISLCFIQNTTNLIISSLFSLFCLCFIRII